MKQEPKERSLEQLFADMLDRGEISDMEYEKLMETLDRLNTKEEKAGPKTPEQVDMEIPF